VQIVHKKPLKIEPIAVKTSFFTGSVEFKNRNLHLFPELLKLRKNKPIIEYWSRIFKNYAIILQGKGG